MAGQLDLLDILAAEKQQATAPCLYLSPARGITARQAEYEAWIAEWGNFGASRRAHAWHVGLCHPETPTDACRPTILSVDLRKPTRHDRPIARPCTCIEQDVLAYRGACRHCDWEGPQRDRENDAVDDAHDHSWPGWRDLPTVPKRPDGDDPRTKQGAKRRAAWLATVNAVYPAGWLEAGGPIRTLRQPMGTRHHVGTPFGGYDLGVLAEPEAT